MIYYKIRDLKTRLYSSGGSDPTWSKKGKVWTDLSSLKHHLTLYCKYNQAEIPVLWEIIELKIEEGEKYPAAVFKKKQ